MFDAVFIPAGKASAEALGKEEKAIEFLNDAYKHCKAIAADKEGITLLNHTNFILKLSDENSKENGVFTNEVPKSNLPQDFIEAMGNHRVWKREKEGK
ncbi:hypothetical protein D9M69_648710 [compost metagenome]